MAKVHAYIISSLKNDMPKFFGKGRKKKELIKTLPILFNRIQEQHLVSASDIPSVDSMKEKLQRITAEVKNTKESMFLTTSQAIKRLFFRINIYN